MGKLIIVKKEQLKMSSEEFEEYLRKDKVGAKLLADRDRRYKESLKRKKEAQ
jgi:hypothetical protein